MRAGEVITKLAEDAYFMKTTKPQIAVELTTVATVPEGSYRLTPTVPGHR
jgi:hypothetical protein